MTSSAVLFDQVAQALSDVIDPELGMSVVDVGLIYSAEKIADGQILIRMTTTTRGCPLSGLLVDAVRARVASLALAARVDVELTYDPPWSADMMRS
ncbi:metal-sulfur cluster assembly factor [Affinirhizobium pseudoryzae]|jgi:metal-sulfur cluster biosynthetic enzyme|uniref:metal-sulfur cluster assembly factor n=1 Tax=Allorhizobium pseudoryzae TaxID=379684 RepID=UPI0013ED7830|nr:metal-sulfur cluster assembly factor [Allorhizobium pseudoryzae]